MNNDLISREALKKEITANHYLLSARNNSIDYGMFTTGIMQAIDNAPPVVNEKLTSERPQGEWIEFKGGYYKCDNCGEVERAKKNFCCKCGAKMKGGEEE